MSTAQLLQNTSATALKTTAPPPMQPHSVSDTVPSTIATISSGLVPEIKKEAPKAGSHPVQLPTPSTKKDTPSGYGAVSGSSHSVSASRHNPLSTTLNGVKTEKDEKTDTVTELPSTATTTTRNTDTEPSMQQQQVSNGIVNANENGNTNTNAQQQWPQQQQQNWAAYQQQAYQQQQQMQQQSQFNMAQNNAFYPAANNQQMLVGPLNPLMAANMALLQQQQQTAAPATAVSAKPPGKRVNQYKCWPPEEQQVYSTYHPLGWPIDPEYPYQINNYLGASSAANSMMTNNMRGFGMNPLLAASQNPMQQLLAAQALNPWLAAGGGLGALGAAAAARLSGGANSVGRNSGKDFSLFVFHLPEDIDEHGLLQLFAPYGAVRSNVVRHETGRGRGFGFVHFNTKHEAQIAIDSMNGHQIGRKRLRVSFKKEMSRDGNNGPSRAQTGMAAPPQTAPNQMATMMPHNSRWPAHSEEHGGK